MEPVGLEVVFGCCPTADSGPSGLEGSEAAREASSCGILKLMLGRGSCAKVDRIFAAFAAWPPSSCKAQLRVL